MIIEISLIIENREKPIAFISDFILMIGDRINLNEEVYELKDKTVKFINRKHLKIEYSTIKRQSLFSNFHHIPNLSHFSEVFKMLKNFEGSIIHADFLDQSHVLRFDNETKILTLVNIKTKKEKAFNEFDKLLNAKFKCLLIMKVEL